MTKVPKGRITKPSRIIFNPNRLQIIDPLDSHDKSLRCRKGLYAHYCYDHNELLIDENDPEFECCNCGKPNTRT